MIRTLVRRSCGHLEAVYAVGAGVRSIHKREKEICGVCRERRTFSERENRAVKTEKTAGNPSGEQDLSGEVEDILKERNSDNNNQGENA